MQGPVGMPTDKRVRIARLSTAELAFDVEIAEASWGTAQHWLSPGAGSSTCIRSMTGVHATSVTCRLLGGTWRPAWPKWLLACTQGSWTFAEHTPWIAPVAVWSAAAARTVFAALVENMPIGRIHCEFGVGCNTVMRIVPVAVNELAPV